MIMSKILDLISQNSADPFKSVWHFLRSWATFLIVSILPSFIIVPLGRLVNRSFASNWTIIDALVILAVAITVLIVSRLFIKK